MATFGITPVSDFPPQTDTGFPNFIQFRSLGTNLGGPDAEIVDFSTGLAATRGTGANAGKVTVTSQGSGAAFSWALADEFYILSAANLDNGLRIGTIVQPNIPTVISIPLDADGGFSAFGSVLLVNENTGAVTVQPGSGVTLHVRSVFDPGFPNYPALAGKYAVASLIRTAANTWTLAGDLLPA